jgi:hypothetical protein
VPAAAPHLAPHLALHLAPLGAFARPTGSSAADEARRYCASVLRGAGFDVSEQQFEYSQFAGRWATPAAGFIVPLGASLMVAAAHNRAPVRVLGAAAVCAALLIVALLRYVGGAGVLGLSILRARGVNLKAVRGSDEPRVWLVAHIDSKWQPVSMLMRVAGVIVGVVGVVGVVVGVFVAGFGAIAPVFAGIAWLGGIPLMLSLVGIENHGTLDNASGVAAVLAAAEQIPRDRAVGVMITDAEELALAGARAWASSAPPAVALNCDSVDDAGALTVMYTGAEPSRLVDALRAAAAATGAPLRVMRLIPGVLTDSVALAHAGWQTVTLSRGNLRTLRRIHTRGDTMAAMRGTGIPVAAAVLAHAVSELS